MNELQIMMRGASVLASRCQPSAFRLRRKRAFTLLELVVVIAILAVLSTVAMRSVSGIASQTRFEVTQRTLDQIQTAILGNPNDHQPDGALVINGFVADMGRLPNSLDELLNMPAGAPLFAVQPAADPNVIVAGGWRGPYVRLSLGATNLCDGWGIALTNYPDGNGGFTVISYGANRPGSVYAMDLSCRVVANNYSAYLAGQVSVLDASNNLLSVASVTNATVKVVIYGPTNSVASTQLLTSNPLTYAFTNVPPQANSLTHGPHAICTYYYMNSIFITNSPVTYLNLHPGFSYVSNLNLIQP